MLQKIVQLKICEVYHYNIKINDETLITGLFKVLLVALSDVSFLCGYFIFYRKIWISWKVVLGYAFLGLVSVFFGMLVFCMK